MHHFKLRNGVNIPPIMLGTYNYGRKIQYKKLAAAVKTAIGLGDYGIDTAREYNNEPLLGTILKKEKRESFFIATKIGNEPQLTSSIKKELDISLRNLKVDFLDLLLLHWPCPPMFLQNWEQMLTVYQSAKVKAIGIANCSLKHLELIQKEIGITADVLPHIIQNEIHPLNTDEAVCDFCLTHNILIESYAATCNMLPLLADNTFIQSLALKYEKNMPQIICRWNYQEGRVPVIHSFNTEHIKENVSYFDFSLNDNEMKKITELNINYKYYLESLYCPGY